MKAASKPDAECGKARFLYPYGIVKHGPWFFCTNITAKKMRTWASVEWMREEDGCAGGLTHGGTFK